MDGGRWTVDGGKISVPRLPSPVSRPPSPVSRLPSIQDIKNPGVFYYKTLVINSILVFVKIEHYEQAGVGGL